MCQHVSSRLFGGIFCREGNPKFLVYEFRARMTLTPADRGGTWTPGAWQCAHAAPEGKVTFWWCFGLRRFHILWEPVQASLASGGGRADLGWQLADILRLNYQLALFGPKPCCFCKCRSATVMPLKCLPAPRGCSGGNTDTGGGLCAVYWVTWILFYILYLFYPTNYHLSCITVLFQVPDIFEAIRNLNQNFYCKEIIFHKRQYSFW